MNSFSYMKIRTNWGGHVGWQISKCENNNSKSSYNYNRFPISFILNQTSSDLSASTLLAALLTDYWRVLFWFSV